MSDCAYAYIYEAGIPHQLSECLDNPKWTLKDFFFPTMAWFNALFHPYTTFADHNSFI